MLTSRFVADGFGRWRHSPEVQAEVSERVNRIFADALARVKTPIGRIWIRFQIHVTIVRELKRLATSKERALWFRSQVQP